MTKNLNLNENFCEDLFWDQNLTWYNASNGPKFTKCFKNVIVVFPIGLFWLILIPWAFWIFPKNSRPKKSLSWNFLMKQLFTVGIIALYIVDLADKFNQLYTLNGSDILYYVISISTMVMTMIVLTLEWLKQIHTSWIFSLFWPFFLFSLAPQLLDYFQTEEDWKSTIPLILIVVVFAQVFLCCFADLKGIKIQEVAPKNLASLYSILFFAWFESMVFNGYRKPLIQSDLPPAPDHLNVQENVQKFLKHWDEHIQKNNVNFSDKKSSTRKRLKLWKPLFSSFHLRFLLSAFIAVFYYVGGFASPLVLKLLIDHIENQTEEAWKGYFYVVLLFISGLFNVFTFSHYIIQIIDVGTQIRSALVSAIVRKSLKLSNSARQKFTTGEITNLISVDTQRLLDNIPYLNVLWGAPLKIIVAMVLIYRELGLGPCLFGTLGLVFLMPPNIIGGKYVEKLQDQQLQEKDLRIKLMNEILNGIKVLKLYAWEIPFMERVNKIRKTEIKYIKFTAVLWSFINFTYCMSPFLITIGCFSGYVLMDPVTNILTPQKVFVCISLLNMLRVPLVLFPITFKESITMLVSLRRITDFLNADELDSTTTTHLDKNEKIDEKISIEITNGSFTWDDPKVPQLKNINLKMKPGSLTAVVGVVGSGKSSLLQAILGDMERTSGQSKKFGQFAYVPQQAWIQNMSLQSNILFSKDFDQEKYSKVIQSCALKDDLKLLANRDQTEIGENGINLSGGQKQRVALARAVYFDADIYLLDDPLSAVDAHVGRHIFEEVISSQTGVLKEKSRLWVTNQVAYLSNVDQVIVLKDGQILEQGTYESLMKSKGALFDFVQDHIVDEETNTIKKDQRNDLTKIQEQEKTLRTEDTESSGKLVEDETSLTGHVPLYVFKDLFMKLGPKIFTLFLIANALEQALHAGGILWLGDWSDSSRINVTSANDEAGYRLGVYSALSIGEAIVMSVRDLIFFLRCALASKLIHNALLDGVLKSPMSFFDTNPLGRIINRFSADIDTLGWARIKSKLRKNLEGMAN